MGLFYDIFCFLVVLYQIIIIKKINCTLLFFQLFFLVELLFNKLNYNGIRDFLLSNTVFIMNPIPAATNTHPKNIPKLL
jgi:hypothetical protein